MLVGADGPLLVPPLDTEGGQARWVSVPLNLTFQGEGTGNKWVRELFGLTPLYKLLKIENPQNFCLFELYPPTNALVDILWCCTKALQEVVLWGWSAMWGLKSPQRALRMLKSFLSLALWVDLFLIRYSVKSCMNTWRWFMDFRRYSKCWHTHMNIHIYIYIKSHLFISP